MKPPLTGTAHALPFEQLSPRDFERLCLWLVTREGYERAEHLGAAGSEQGRDVLAWQDGQCWAFQCKRYQTFTAADALKEIDKIAALPADQKPVGLVFVVTSDVSANARRQTRERCRKEGLACEFWVGTELDEKVKRHDDIVQEFFQVSYGSPVPPHTLRAAVGDFTGRVDDIKALVGYLSRDGGTAAITGIRGMGGIGKTELALVVAHELSGQYPDAQLMVELQPGGTPLTPEAVLERVIHALRSEEKLPDGLAELQGACRAALAGKRGLLLLDNAAGPEQVRPLLPAPAGWAVIVTSRARFTLPGAWLHDLELLPLGDAMALLRRLLSDGGREDVVGAGGGPSTALRSAQDAGETPGLRELAKRCGRLPLALRVAAGYLTTYRDWSLPDYLAALARAPLAHLTAPGEQPVQAVLGLSITALRERDAVLAERWEQLAVFPAAFDRAAAAAVWGTLGDAPAEDVRAWPTLAPLNEEGTRQALSALVQQSLLDYARDSETYTLHDLLRECALAAPTVDLDGARLRHAWHYLGLGREADDLYMQGGAQVAAGLRQFEGAWPHLAAAWLRMRGQADGTARRWVNAYPDAVAYVLDLRIVPREQIAVREAAAQAARVLGDRRGEGAHLGNLGIAYAELGGARRAIGYFEQALAISREMGDRRGEGSDLGNLGIAYKNLGEARRAIGNFEQALAISREIGDRHNEGNWLGSLGLAYADLGEARRAIEYHEQALAISREIGDRRGEGNKLGNLGSAYHSLGEARRAIGFHEQALAISREIGDRRNEGNWLGSLGLAYKNLGEARRAIGNFEQALAISREIDDRRNEENWLGNLGSAYYSLGEARRAIGYYEQALAISREIGDRRGEGNALANMGVAYEGLEERERARGLWAEALGIFEAIESPYAERVRRWLAGLETGQVEG